MYEMMVGYPPFCSDEPITTCRKIINWRQHLRFPDDARLSPDAVDLMRRLLCDVDSRLGTQVIVHSLSLPPPRVSGLGTFARLLSTLTAVQRHSFSVHRLETSVAGNLWLRQRHFQPSFDVVHKHTMWAFLSLPLRNRTLYLTLRHP